MILLWPLEDELEVTVISGLKVGGCHVSVLGSQHKMTLHTITSTPHTVVRGRCEYPLSPHGMLLLAINEHVLRTH